jgi:rSAM/selenodomain-associated transferase 1
MTRHLAVFARRAVSGRVKTRLSPALPPALARELHAAMTADTLATVAAAEADDRSVLWDVPVADDAAPIDVPEGIHAGVQSGADLGTRLVAAFAPRLAAPGDAAVIVGTDGPDLRPRHLAAAFTALGDHDVVLGPSRDGGYWLIGLSRPAPSLFDGISWGGPEVLAQTLDRARRAGLQVAQLETLADVDTPEDLARLVAEWLVAPATERAPRTARALERMGLLPPATRAPAA